VLGELLSHELQLEALHTALGRGDEESSVARGFCGGLATVCASSGWSGAGEAGAFGTTAVATQPPTVNHARCAPHAPFDRALPLSQAVQPAAVQLVQPPGQGRQTLPDR
jgi:hypothetical protein